MKRTVLLALLSAVLLTGCSGKFTPAKKVSLTAGTPVKLVLLQQLEAGKQDKGDEVPFLVAEDVKGADGSVLIAKGALARGEVTWSRSEGSLSGLMNQPARLAVDVVETKAVDGTTVLLKVDTEGKEEAYQFNRGNTGRVDLGDKLEQVWQNESTQKVLTRLNESFNGQGDFDFDDAETKEALHDVARQLSLENLTQALDQGKTEEVKGILSQIKSGGALVSVATGDPTLALGAVMDLVNLAGGVGDKLGRMLKGRTIRAFPGTELTVQVESPVTVSVVPAKE